MLRIMALVFAGLLSLAAPAETATYPQGTSFTFGDSGPVEIEAPIVTRYYQAPVRTGVSCINPLNCVDIKEGFAKIQIVPIEDSPLVQSIIYDKQGNLLLPSEYYPALERAMMAGDVKRAYCDAVTLIFQNFKNPLPLAKYPTTNHHGVIRVAAELKYTPRADTPGFGYYYVALVTQKNEKKGARASRIHFPAELFSPEREPNPMMQIEVWESGQKVRLIGLPEGVEGENSMFSTPKNPKFNRENSLHLAAINGRRAFMPIVPKETCSTVY